MSSLKNHNLNRFSLGSFHDQHVTNFCKAVFMVDGYDGAHPWSQCFRDRGKKTASLGSLIYQVTAKQGLNSEDFPVLKNYWTTFQIKNIIVEMNIKRYKHKNDWKLGKTPLLSFYS